MLYKNLKHVDMAALYAARIWKISPLS